MSKLEDLKKEVQPDNKLIIFGAQNHARGMADALKICAPEIQVMFFLVSARKNNPEYISGIEVKTIDTTAKKDKEIPVLVATPDIYFDEIVETLNENGFYNIVDGTFGGDFDNEMRVIYYKNQFIDEERKFEKLSEVDINTNIQNIDLCMYMAKSVVDKPLKNIYNTPTYIRTVQAGAAMTDKVIADCKDDIGENISRKNRNYCECTVTHYVWKQAKEAYVGLCHYRRRFQWSEYDIKVLRSGSVDVVLPYPVVTKIYEIHYKPYVDEQVFDTMLSVLKEYYPEYYKTAVEAMQGDVFYPCNMLLARKDIFDAYAEWLFSVLEKVEVICGDETVRTDRYLGYLAEHLTTFYFIHNRSNMRIVHSRMEILR